MLNFINSFMFTLPNLQTFLNEDEKQFLEWQFRIKSHHSQGHTGQTWK